MSDHVTGIRVMCSRCGTGAFIPCTFKAFHPSGLVCHVCKSFKDWIVLCFVYGAAQCEPAPDAAQEREDVAAVFGRIDGRITNAETRIFDLNSRLERLEGKGAEAIGYVFRRKSDGMIAAGQLRTFEDAQVCNPDWDALPVLAPIESRKP